MTRTPALALIHTLHQVIPVLDAICRRRLPGVRAAHLLDETILRDAMARGGADADIVQRVCELVVLAERGGADAVLITCSSLGPSLEAAARLVRVPVRRIDAPMAAQAVRRGGRVAVAATVRSTLDPTVSLIRAEAGRRNKRLRVETALFAKAFDARVAGNPDEHDRILEKGLSALAARCRTLVLAQASMARVAAKLSLPKGVKLLTSPESGIAQMKRLLLPS